MTTWTCMSLHDDQVGQGDMLAFPTMSTCAAILCNLDDRLVGIHKTIGWVAQTDMLVRIALEMIDGDPVRGLYILGWDLDDTDRHDVARIRDALGCQGVPTWTYNYSNRTGEDGVRRFQAPRSFGDIVVDLCTLARFRAGDDPVISVKRTSKVFVKLLTVGEAFQDHLAEWGNKALRRGLEEEITINSGNTHRIRKRLDFRRL